MLSRTKSWDKFQTSKWFLGAFQRAVLPHFSVSMHCCGFESNLLAAEGGQGRGDAAVCSDNLNFPVPAFTELPALP